MICNIQVAILGEDGREETFEIACLERTDLKPETLGLTLAEGKRILKDLQQIVVESLGGELSVARAGLSGVRPAALQQGSSHPFGPHRLRPAHGKKSTAAPLRMRAA